MNPSSNVFVATAALCLSLSAWLQPIHAQSLADVIERSEKSLVRIEVKSDDGDSLGSGFVIDNATIATNVHVLAGARSAKAIFPDQKTFTIVGTLHVDPKRDIAIARIDGTGVEQLPRLSFANALVRKGERVTALGSPLGLSFSATTGVVSAIRTATELGKELGDKELEGTWIQVDAALSPGNSGGPIINDAGEIVAMSTLASQGAQNLNFGISGQDVNSARQLSAGKNVVPLPEGVGKMKGKEGRGRGERGIIDPKDIPQKAIEAYVTYGRTEYKTIIRDLTRELDRLKTDLRQMKAGETYIPILPDGRQADIVRENLGKKGRKWYFRSETVKRREIADAEARQRELTKVKDLTSATPDKITNEGLFALLSKYGPRLDGRNNGSIGFLAEAIVLHSFNDHDVLVIYDDTPYLLYLQSTTGLFLGQEVTPQPVYVAGTATAEIEEGTTASFTVLQGIPQDELRTSIFGNAAVQPPISNSPSANSVTSQSPGVPRPGCQVVRAL